MIKLPLSLRAWDTEAFNATLKTEICTIDQTLLPLQQGLKNSSFANGDSLSVTILKAEEDIENILVRTGLFYTGIIAGCNCADDPTPVDENNEYCEVLFVIDKKTAETTVNLIE